jgi:menaquinone-dependent protoporphyrinogen oxidase
VGQRVLVAYATKHGATAEIAERIANTLRETGHTVETVPVPNVGSLKSYDAVILGSAVYMGKWRKEAAKFLKRQQGTLSQKPVWIFSTGPLGEGDPVELVHGEKLPKSLQPIADSIGARDVQVFFGAATVESLGGFEKWVLNKVHAELGDFRDWNTIEKWAKDIATALQ